MNFDPRLTQEVADAICERSAAGEGVLAIIADMGLPDNTIDWLQKNHMGAVVAAKQRQIQARFAAAESKPVEEAKVE